MDPVSLEEHLEALRVYDGAIGTLSTAGTHRFANSAFRNPDSVLGR